MENDSSTTKQVLSMLLKIPNHMTRKSMLNKLYGTACANDLDRIINRLSQSDVIVGVDQPDGQTAYKLTDRVTELVAQKYPELLPKPELEKPGATQSSGVSTIQQVDHKKRSRLEKYIIKYKKMNLSDDAIVTLYGGLEGEDTVRSALDKLRKDGELK
ncbi:MAG: hypothetical protein ACLQOO_03670 [Terriglobia bacterium]